MNRRDFLCGAGCLMAGFALGKIKELPPNNGIYCNDQRFKSYDHRLRYMLVGVSSHCNLNCKGCTTFSPLAKQEFISASQFEKDFTKIKKILGNCETVSLLLQGGEPLLNPELKDIIKLTRKIFPTGEHYISTNGIALSEQNEEFWKLIKANKVGLQITKYPIDIDRNTYEEKIKKYKIKVNYSTVEANKLFSLKTKAPVNAVYRKYGFPWGKPVIDLQGKQDPKEKFTICPRCSVETTYVRGNLYYCYNIAYINAFIEYFNLDIDIPKDDYLKVADIKSIEDLYRYFSKTKQMCKYCKYRLTVQYGKPGTDWDFSKKELSEWTE